MKSSRKLQARKDARVARGEEPELTQSHLKKLLTPKRKPLTKKQKKLKKKVLNASYMSSSYFLNSVSLTTGMIDGAFNAPDVYDCKNSLTYANYNSTDLITTLAEENVDGSMFYSTNLLRLWAIASSSCFKTEQDTERALAEYSVLLENDTDHISENALYLTNPYFTYMRRCAYILSLGEYTPD